MKLLIADDEVVIRNGLLSLDWKSIGIEEVFSVSNGDEARELLMSVPIDIVIFDIQMPGMSGLELAELVKMYSMDTAVVLLTGYSEFEYARRAMKSEVYEYILKPVNPRELLNTMENVKTRLERARYQKRVVREYEDVEGTFDTVTQVRNQFSRVSQSVLTILTDMASEYPQQISLGQLSERYHFTGSYISKKIKKETGYSFQELLNAIRLMNAAMLLIEGEKVNQACEKAGFNDQRYFSQVFRRVFSCSPSEYKKQQHNIKEVRFRHVLENTVKNQME